MIINNLLRQDPTRTSTLRAKFESQMNLRFTKLKREIVRAIVEQDVFGLNALTANFNPYHDARGRFAHAPFSAEHIAAISEYEGAIYGSQYGGFAAIQNYLRTGSLRYAGGENNQSDLDRVVRHIDSAMSQSHTTQDLSTYRGVQNIVKQAGVNSISEVVPGLQFTDKGYFSTTLDKGIASNSFARRLNSGDAPAVIKVQLKSGQNALTTGNSEKEVILPRNSTFKVVRVTRRGSGRDIHYEVTVDVLNSTTATTQNQLKTNLQDRQFEFLRSDKKIDAFMLWLDEMEAAGILDIIHGPSMYGGSEPWTNVYIDSAYKQGMRRANAELKKKGYDVPPSTGFLTGAKDPITIAFNQPFHAERVAIIYTRAFNELKGITKAMDQQISRTLAQGMVDGKNPKQIARDLVDRVDKIGITRARTLARTEVISAHHQATINTYEQWGVMGVTVQAEWLTAGFNVCPICVANSGKVYSLTQIRSMIPAHPNCRCAAIPVVKENSRASRRR